jgi:oligopeptidase B
VIITCYFVHYCTKVLGGFDASEYFTERKWAPASDGTQVPMSIVYRKNLVNLDGSDPLLLYGYGSYEVI